VDVAERQESPKPRTGEAVFRIEGLNARYGASLAVKGVDLEIEGNLVTAVIGPSGCGIAPSSAA